MGAFGAEEGVVVLGTAISVDRPGTAAFGWVSRMWGLR